MKKKQAREGKHIQPPQNAEDPLEAFLEEGKRIAARGQDRERRLRADVGKGHQPKREAFPLSSRVPELPRISISREYMDKLRIAEDKFLYDCENLFAQGNEGALRAAFDLCDTLSRPLPKWVAHGMRERWPDSPRPKKWLKEYHKRMAEQLHTFLVERERDNYSSGRRDDDQPPSWKDIYKVASQESRNYPPYAASPRMIERNYARFKRISAKNPNAYYEFDCFKPAPDPKSPR
jgi:hypothetical protein